MIDWIHFNLHGCLNFISGLYTLGVALFVWTHNPRSSLHRRFLLLSVAPSIWMMCFGMISLVNDPTHSVFWLKGAYLLGVPFISPGVFVFSECWAHRNRLALLISSYGIGALFALMMVAWQPQFLVIHEYSWGRFDRVIPSLQSHVYYILFSIFFLTFAGLAFQNFFDRMKASTNTLERAQARNVLIGMAIAYTGSVDFAVVFGAPLYPFGYLSVTALMTIMAYTIVQYHVFDIKVFARKAALLVLIYVLLALFIVPIGFHMFDRLMVTSFYSPRSIAIIVGVGVGVLFSTGPLIYAAIVKRSYWLKGHHTLGLVHELKSPLASIEGASDVLIDDLAHGLVNPQKFQSYLTMVQTSTIRLQQFVKDLLAVAQESSEIVIEKKPFHFRDMIEAQIAYAMPRASQKGLHITLASSEDVIITADHEKIAHVLSNLLSNAIKYSHSGTISLEYELISSKMLRCSVVDQGIGIAPSQLDKIFDRFVQVDRGHQGTGIGLTIARMWVNAHGGKIWAESQGEGKGAKFCFMLPK